MSLTQVILNTTEDITEHVAAVSQSKATAGDYGQLAINDINELQGVNTRGFWDTNNPISPFFNSLQDFNTKIEIFLENQNVFTGTISTIKANNESARATVLLKSELQTALEQGIIYASDDQATPSQIIDEIASLYKIKIDNISFSRSSFIYNQNNIFLSAFYQGETTVLKAIENIAQIGIARVYADNNRLHLDVFHDRDDTPLFTFTDDVNTQTNLYSNPQTELLEKEEISGYQIEWIGGAGGNLVTFGNEESRGKQINAGADQPVKIMTLNAAVWIGERWLEYLNSKVEKITFKVAANIGKSLSILDGIRVDYKGRSNIVDIVEIDRSGIVSYNVTGVVR
jgi:hypothetical protein